MSDDTAQITVDLPEPPFFSFAEFRATHTALLRRQQDQDSADLFAHEVASFIRRGRATGALLAESGDRKAAQSILDYWLTGFYRLDQEPPDATLLEFDPEQAPELPDTACPYVGLEAFREENKHLFFGRQRLITELIEQLRTNPLLAVVGPSGSGKSSLVRAGLIPTLMDGAIADSAAWHYCRPIVPGSDPIMALARLTRPPDMGTPTWRDSQFQRFQEDPGTLAALLEHMVPMPSVIVIDQFEELFTLCDDEQIQQAFVANLLGLIQSPDRRHILIVTMRSDFEPFVTRLEPFYQSFKAAKVVVPPLDASELRDAITQPAEHAGLTFETGVVDALLYDLLGEPAALPLLQFTLLKLWENRERNRVTMATYRRIGGGRTALANSADTFYDHLIPEEQVTARRILLRMVRPGEGLEVTSRRIRLHDLNPVREDPDRVHRVLTRLIDARLVNRTTGDTDDEANIQLEVAHEALIRNWPRLVGWLEDERSLLRQRMRLTNAAEQWERLGREPSALLRGSLLTEILRDKQRISELNRLERAYITASLLAEEAEQHRKEEQYQQAQAFAEERARRAEAEHQRAEEELRRLAAEQQQAHEQARAEAQARVAQRMRRLTIMAIAAAAIALIIAAINIVQQRTIVALQGSIVDSQATGTVVVRQAVSAQTAARRAISAADATQVVVQETNVALGTAQSSMQGTATRVAARRNAANQQSTALAASATAAQSTSIALVSIAEAQRATEAVIGSREARVTAQEQENRAQELAKESLAAADTRIALEKAIEAANLSSNSLVEDALQLAIQRNTNPVQHGSLTSATWSPDGQYILTTGNDNTAKIWSATDAPPFLTNEATLRGHSDTVTSAAWSNNGQYIVTTSEDGTTKIWKTDDWQDVRTLQKETNEIRSAAWSPTDAWLATTDAQAINIWNPEDGSVINTIPSPDQRLTYAAWSGDGNYIVTTNQKNGRTTIWDVQTGERLPELPGTAKSATWRESEILTAGADGITRLWDAINVNAVTERRSYNEHEGPVYFATWHCAGTQFTLEDTQFILTAGQDGTARVWKAENNARSLATLQSARINSTPLTMATTDPGCTRTVTVDRAGNIRIYYVAFEKIRETAQELLQASP